MDSYSISLNKLILLLNEISEKKETAAKDGEACALACLFGSLESRISYLREFESEDSSVKQLELNCELDGLLNLMENEIEALSSSKFDFDFLSVYMTYLEKLREIRG